MAAQEEARRRSSGAPGVELGPFGKKFVGLGLVLLGLWVAPGPAAPSAAWIVPGGLLALGALGLLKGIRESAGSGWQPFADSGRTRGAMFRMIWALRPRLWMIGWALIVGVFIAWGSPHLRIEYGGGACTYFGLNGVETQRTHGECPLVEVIPLR